MLFPNRLGTVLSYMYAAPGIATRMYNTSMDPFTKEEVTIACVLQERKMYRTLMQVFIPENYFLVRDALLETVRADLIGSGCDCLIPANPPKEALEARRSQANKAMTGGKDHDHYHSVANPARGEKPGERGLNKGYRPGRNSARKRKR